MVEKKLFAKTLPVLLGFFVMGFCDIVGISSDYAASAFGWSATMAGLIPSVVFVWFFLLGVPFGLMMNRIGRKNTVLTQCDDACSLCPAGHRQCDVAGVA